jgi:hypothetical protein
MAGADFQIPAKCYPTTGVGFTSGSEMIDAVENMHSLNPNVGGQLIFQGDGKWELRVQVTGVQNQQVANIGDVVVFYGGTVEALSVDAFDARYGGS